MVSVRTIERRTPWGWETLLVVNGVIGRAEELLCLEELKPEWEHETYRVVIPFTDATVRPAEFANSVAT